MRNSFPIVALLTDFGLRDHYVGTMKATVLSINPDIKIIDITHEVAPQNIRQASYFLWAAYKYFPAKTIFTCVVDPGVGSSRRIIAVRTKNYTFLAPDNGLLDLVRSEESIEEAIEIDYRSEKVKSFVLPNVSSTFHGRDIFAPIAAHLAAGVPLQKIGEKVYLDRPVNRFFSFVSSEVRPKILHIDHFGNIITNVKGSNLESVKKELKGFGIKWRQITKWVENYDSAPAKEPCLIVGSSGLVEIVVKNANAARLLAVNSNTPLGLIKE